MAAFYTEKSWTERQSEHPTRRRLTLVETVSASEAIYDVSREEGNVTTTGDAFDKSNMDDLEGRISEGFNSVETAFQNEPDVYYGSTPPDNSLGKDGDLYILIGS